MEKQRAVGYVRVSTAEQAEGYGLDAQSSAIRAYCRDYGLDLTCIVEDAGYSGSDASRPGLAEALSRLDSGEAEVLIVARLDRLARDLVLQETIMSRAAVVSVAEPDLDGDPTRVLVRQVLGAIAQYERALIAARMSAGKAAKRAAGGYAGGRPPYGWRVEAGELVPDERERDVARLVSMMRAGGASYRAIARTLSARGMRPRSGRWHPSTLRSLVGAAVAG